MPSSKTFNYWNCRKTFLRCQNQTLDTNLSNIHLLSFWFSVNFFQLSSKIYTLYYWMKTTDSLLYLICLLTASLSLLIAFTSSLCCANISALKPYSLFCCFLSILPLIAISRERNRLALTDSSLNYLILISADLWNSTFSMRH